MFSKATKLLLILSLFANCLYAQTPTASLIPWAKAQWFDVNGDPLFSGKIFTYAAGGTTPLATYTTYTQSGTNANPVILDSAGRANIFLGPACYNIVAQNSAGVQQWTLDGVCDIGLMLKAGVLAPVGNLLPAADDFYNVGSSSLRWKDYYVSEMIQISGSAFATLAPTSSGRQYFDSTLGYYQCSESNTAYTPCSPFKISGSTIINKTGLTPLLDLKGAGSQAGQVRLFKNATAFIGSIGDSSTPGNLAIVGGSAGSAGWDITVGLGLQVHSSFGGTTMFAIAPAIIADQTNVFLTVDKGAGIVFTQAVIGAADSCTAGFRCLRIPN